MTFQVDRHQARKGVSPVAQLQLALLQCELRYVSPNAFTTHTDRLRVTDVSN